MPELTVNTDDHITRAIELEREKYNVLAEIAEHRQTMRHIADMFNDSNFGQFVDNFYPAKSRGQTKDPKQVKAAGKWKRELLAQHGVTESATADE